MKSHDDHIRLILGKLNQMDEKLDMVLRKLHWMSKTPATNSTKAADDSARCLPDKVILPLDSVWAVNDLDNKLPEPDKKCKLVSEICTFCLVFYTTVNLKSETNMAAAVNDTKHSVLCYRSSHKLFKHFFSYRCRRSNKARPACTVVPRTDESTCPAKTRAHSVVAILL